jgi:hypothetical protein
MFFSGAGPIIFLKTCVKFRLSFLRCEYKGWKNKEVEEKAYAKILLENPTLNFTP